MTLEEVAKLAPLLTASIALSAAVIALISLSTQKSLARKKSSIDFFLKTEMDKYMMEQYSNYRNGIDLIGKGIQIHELYNSHKDAYEGICTYLNILELMASGIRFGAFDDKICRNFWFYLITGAAKSAKLVIEKEREASSPLLYFELEKLASKWERKT